MGIFGVPKIPTQPTRRKKMRQIDKNTVSSKGQLKESEFVTFINAEGKGKRILL